MRRGMRRCTRLPPCCMQHEHFHYAAPLLPTTVRQCQFDRGKMSSDEELACAAIVATLCQRSREKKKRVVKNWTEDWLLQRRTKGSYGGIFSELAANSDIFKKYMRFSLSTFQVLLEKVTPYIEKEDTHLRSSITPGARLEATLLFLISGLPYSRLQYETRISATSLCRIIPETCDAIYAALKDEFMKVR